MLFEACTIFFGSNSKRLLRNLIILLIGMDTAMCTSKQCRSSKVKLLSKPDLSPTSISREFCSTCVQTISSFVFVALVALGILISGALDDSAVSVVTSKKSKFRKGDLKAIFRCAGSPHGKSVTGKRMSRHRLHCTSEVYG